jgi:hypothetical protein
MGIVDANGHSLAGSDEEDLPNKGKDAKEGEEQKAKMQDVRLIPSGTLEMNLCAVMNNTFFMEMNVEQAEQAAKQQRAIMDSPMLQAMKDQLKQMHSTRITIVNNMNERTAKSDEAYWSTLKIDETDRTKTEEAEPEETPPAADAQH